MSATAALFKPLKVGGLDLQHRVAMSAMTRLRCDPATYAPRALNAEYYRQRSSPGGFLLSEAAAVSPAGRGYLRAPNMYDASNVEGWRLVTGAVHEAGGKIFAQLFHAGRVTHSSILALGQPKSLGPPLSASAVRPEGVLRTPTGKLPYEEPAAMTQEQIKTVVAEFRAAAKAAVEAGFDGIELHGGNGYLLQSFLAKKTNLREDGYGGSVPNRCRLLLEIVDACSDAIGPGRVAVKLQQGVTFSDLIEPQDDALAQLDHLGPELGGRGLAYVCLSSLNGEPYYKFAGLPEPNFSVDPFKYFRARYDGVLAVNGGLSPEQAAGYVADGTADFAFFGVLFVSNANLAELAKAGAPLDHGGADPATWYGGAPQDDAKKYTDWPLVKP